MSAISAPQPETSDPVSFYRLIEDDVVESTSATTSPWDVTQQHGGPPSALLARAIENCQPRDDLAVGRISLDFLGGIPQGRLTVQAEVLRPGRRVELVSARLIADGRDVAVARAWRMQVSPASAPTVRRERDDSAALPAEPQEQRYFQGIDPLWGYGRAVEWRFVRGSYEQRGPASVWARPRIPLVDSEQTSALQRTLIVADSANGLSAELDVDEWLFIPPGLTVTLYREPAPDWLRLDASTVIDQRGSGMAHATLNDEFGEFGVATQPLLVQSRRR